MRNKSGNQRCYYLLFVVLILVSGISVKLFSLQVIRHNFYTALAANQQDFFQQLIPQRGEIFVSEEDNSWNRIATNRDLQSVFLSPNEVTDKNKVTDTLGSLLGLPTDEILQKLGDKNDLYEPLKSKLDDETAVKIRDLNLSGVHLTAESWRWYPQGTLASDILGFVGFSGNKKIGQYGLEQYYENKLVGKAGILESKKDALGRWMLTSDYNLEPAQDGSQLYLTVDQNIQFFTEQKLKAVTEKLQGTSACAIVMDPKSGAIRAMVSLPDYDPNEYQKTQSIDYFTNSCISKPYEIGSVFKPVVVAAGLDLGKITPETTYVDTGSIQFGGYTINNAENRIYGLSTMTKVLEKSINTGAIFIQNAIGQPAFKKYINDFGFGEVTGIDLAGEAEGNLKNLNEPIAINYATASFGQGITATSLQMANAVAVIANGGKLMKPYIVEKIVESSGQEANTAPQVIRNVISSQVAGQLTAMLVSTVRNGYDKIKIKNYFVAGKTGTAQIPNKDRSGYSDETIHSFVGYAPAYDPKFLIFLEVENPRGIKYASDSLAPTFSELAQYILNYYQIPPEE